MRLIVTAARARRLRNREDSLSIKRCGPRTGSAGTAPGGLRDPVLARGLLDERGDGLGWDT